MTGDLGLFAGMILVPIALIATGVAVAIVAALVILEALVSTLESNFEGGG